MSNNLFPQLLQTLQNRFQKNLHRHPNLTWADIQTRLQSNSTVLQTVAKMDETGGEPDVIQFDGKLIFTDFCRQSPTGRRSTCYDSQARLSRKKFPPKTSAIELADSFGAHLLDENLYRYVQSIESLDTTTSSWLLTPQSVRSKGGAIFGDCRYGQVFVYHNGADSYYDARGFRVWARL